MLGSTAQTWRDRAAEMNDQIVESPTRWQRVTNAIYSLLASIYESNAETYQDQADALYAEARQHRDNPVLEAQIAALEQQASDLLLAAQQAQAEADALQSDIDTLIAQAQAAEAQAEEYRQLVANPPPVARDTVYVYNETGQVLGEYDEQGTVIREYLYLDGAPLALVSDGEVYYYHNDHLDTPQLLTDAAQQIVWQASYTPFGKADIVVEEVTSNLRFPGQYFDSETGLHYNYFRDYDPSTGRYIQSDPIGLEGGINTYGYALQNPIRYTDPFGLATWKCTRLNLTVSPLVLTFGKIFYFCESECINGEKTIARWDVGIVGPSFGIEFDASSSSDNEFIDNNETPSADVFDGNYVEVGAGVTPIVGGSLGRASINGGVTRGGVSGNLTGGNWGLAIGAAELAGKANLIWEKQIDCDEACEQ